MKKVLVDLVVKEVQQVNASCVLLVMASETPFSEVRPGQFAELRIDETPTVMLRRPISVHSFNAEKNEIGFLVQVVGDGTRWLGSLKAGDKVNTLLPLGNGFTMPVAPGKRYLLVGGGVGSAPLYYLAEELKKGGNEFTILIGARSAKDLYRREAYEALGRVEYTTEDGSLGEKGYVTNHSLLAEKYDCIYTCGPKPMMMAVARYARENNIACEVSLENKMACGLGACLCCVEDTKEGHKCVCTDGPVFSIDELKW
ncbi:MAG: dihydroorotate dehydrogenase electron transfer subunit [Bacteroidaceae bacterium]|nr:dihydroorotate dehydrogenase electron transfer subunit [Bacteroidaceae bacterium]